jgi:class 3 adenylate cyclase
VGNRALGSRPDYLQQHEREVMALLDEITTEANLILAQPWNIRDGLVVPEANSVQLAGGGVRLTPVMLYADLADSTLLASKFDRGVATKVIKSFLAASCRIIRARGGHIRSFDGDRVMGVFLGERMHTRAALAALNINWVVTHLLKPKIMAQFPSLALGGYNLQHGVGIDKSEVLVARSGIHDNNDLIWVGRAPNIAAKLAALREDGYASYMTKVVYDQLAPDGKVAADGRDMWQLRLWTKAPLEEVKSVYRSNFWWQP